MKLAYVRDYVRWGLVLANPGEVARAKQRDGELYARFRDGRRFVLRGGPSDAHVFRRVFLSDEYRLRGAGPWETVVDLGGNVGCFAFLVAPRARRVIVYEPDPHNLAILERNLAGHAHARVVPEAVAAQPGRAVLRTAASGRWGGRSTLFADLATQRADTEVEVAVTTLDALFADHGIDRCDLLKIDVEGAEYEILGAASDDTLARIARIVGEYHDVCPEDPRTRIAAFRGFLERSGFRVETEPSRRRANTGLFFAERR